MPHSRRHGQQSVGNRAITHARTALLEKKIVAIEIRGQVLDAQCSLSPSGADTNPGRQKNTGTWLLCCRRIATPSFSTRPFSDREGSTPLATKGSRAESKRLLSATTPTRPRRGTTRRTRRRAGAKSRQLAKNNTTSVRTCEGVNAAAVVVENATADGLDEMGSRRGRSARRASWRRQVRDRLRHIGPAARCA